MKRIAWLVAPAIVLCACGGGRSPAEESDAAPPIPLLDVPYDPDAPADPLRRLDIYPPPSGEPAPVVVWVHGGGWHSGDKGNNMADKIALFNGAGYVLVSINYRLSPTPTTSPDPARIKYPVHEQDVARAIAWVHAHVAEHGGDATRLALLGHSAGAHLVALVATDPGFLGAHGLALSNIRCVGSFDTEAYDIPTTLTTATDEARALYVNAFGDDDAVWTTASPISHIVADAGIGDFLLAARGGADRRAAVAAFRDSLAASDVAVEVIDATSLTHEEVNDRIGAPGDTVMTPPLTGFLERCFS